MKKILMLGLVAVMVMLASCSKEKEYTISGSFDIPMDMQFGDTVISRNNLEGMVVHLLQLDGTPIDTACVLADETFEISGVCMADQPYFAYLVCNFGTGLLVIEPGEVRVVFGSEDIRVSGTPCNDDITEMDLRLGEMQEAAYARILDVYKQYQEEGRSGELNQEVLLPYYQEAMDAIDQMLDSVYEANQENPVGAYAAVHLTESIDSVEEFEEHISRYSLYVQNSELMQLRRDYLYRNVGGENPAEADDESEDELMFQLPSE